jgi:putative SOS response-associated peptidase YedK
VGAQEEPRGGEFSQIFTIHTTTPNQPSGAIHDRMPVIVPRYIAPRRLLPKAPLEFGRSLLLMARVIFFPALRPIGLA